ncbi:MAG: hypothetical protein K6G48_07345 [Acholeplasmatales bacterium]|nr:hypothetical protein [Acholeplasmatales bacterium]
MKKLLFPILWLSLLCLASCSSNNSDDQDTDDTTGAGGSISIGGGSSGDDESTDISDTDETIDGGYEVSSEGLNEAYNDLLKGNFTVTFYTMDDSNNYYEYYFKFDATFETDDSGSVIDRNNGYGVNNFDNDGLTYCGPSGGAVLRQYMYYNSQWYYRNDVLALYDCAYQFAKLIDPTDWKYRYNKKLCIEFGKSPYLYFEGYTIIYDGLASDSFVDGGLPGDIYQITFTSIGSTEIEIDPNMETTAIAA